MLSSSEDGGNGNAVDGSGIICDDGTETDAPADEE